ncbi:MAG: hypothetical protein ABI432_10440 [Flavobacteriales bacterium]
MAEGAFVCESGSWAKQTDHISTLDEAVVNCLLLNELGVEADRCDLPVPDIGSVLSKEESQFGDLECDRAGRMHHMVRIAGSLALREQAGWYIHGHDGSARSVNGTHRIGHHPDHRRVQPNSKNRIDNHLIIFYLKSTIDIDYINAFNASLQGSPVVHGIIRRGFRAMRKTHGVDGYPGRAKQPRNDEAIAPVVPHSGHDQVADAIRFTEPSGTMQADQALGEPTGSPFHQIDGGDGLMKDRVGVGRSDPIDRQHR